MKHPSKQLIKLREFKSVMETAPPTRLSGDDTVFEALAERRSGLFRQPRNAVWSRFGFVSGIRSLPRPERGSYLVKPFRYREPDEFRRSAYEPRPAVSPHPERVQVQFSDRVTGHVLWVLNGTIREIFEEALRLTRLAGGRVGDLSYRRLA